MTEPLPVYVLIGGRSERFGRAKATYPVEGEPWARHVASRLADDLLRVAIVGKSAPPELRDLRFVADHPNTDGPIAGVLAAVLDRQQRFGPGRLVLVSCDLVRPQSSWLVPLKVALDADDAFEVAAYRVDDLWQPFPMCVHTRWQTRIEGWIESDGKLSLQALLNESAAAAVAWSALPTSGPPQANTPEALQAMLDDQAGVKGR